MIYVRAVLELLRSRIPVHGLAHITGGGVRNLLRLTESAGFAVEDPLPNAPVIDLVIERAGVSPQEAWEVFNMGCGFVAVVSEPSTPTRRPPCSRSHHPGTRRIGTATREPGVTVSRLRYG